MEVSFAIALLAGMGSFFSPCIFPLLPVYFSVLSGVSVQDLGRAEVKRVFLSALMFVLGFTAVFMALGASFGSIGYLLLRWRPVLQVVGG
ncbi:MAG: cytochrome c biogenesis protein CcdA, partial [Deltaproteobacteria bacterium]